MSEQFKQLNITESDIIRKDDEFLISAKVIADMLNTTTRAIQKTIKANKSEFGGAYLRFAPYQTPGGKQKGYLLTEEGVYIYCMLSRTERAKEVRKVFAQLIKSIRAKEFVHISKVKEMANVMANERVDGYKLVNFLENKYGKIKLNRYKKLKELGLSMNEAARALKLPRQKMGKYEQIEGIYKLYTATNNLPLFQSKRTKIESTQMKLNIN